MEQPVRLETNTFWGRRSGSYLNLKPKNIATPWGNVFKIKRGGIKSSDNNGPTGCKTRWYLARALSNMKRPIRNPEHQRKSTKRSG